MNLDIDSQNNLYVGSVDNSYSWVLIINVYAFDRIQCERIMDIAERAVNDRYQNLVDAGINVSMTKLGSNYTESTATEATKIVDQGLLYRLPDDWKERWPNVAKVYSVTSLGPMLEELFGGTYFIPRARFFYNLPSPNPETDPLANHWCLWMRSDWIEAVGKEVKSAYTIPEVLEIAKLIKEQDPGQVGAALAPISG